METITSGNIRFSEESLQELDGTQVMVTIRKTDIFSIELSFGESVERPVLQLAAGVLMCLLGLMMGVWPMLGYFMSYELSARTPHFLPLVSAATLIIFGAYTIAPIFRRCHYLLVRTSSGERKLPIKECTPNEVISAGRSLGYMISEQ